MTRPKVDPDKRQRTACACDSCKRRKQKCNGQYPCNTCLKRSLPCKYTPAPVNPEASQDSVTSPLKRRHVDTSSDIFKSNSSTKARPRQASMQLPPSTAWDPSDIPAMSLVNSDHAHHLEVRMNSAPTQIMSHDDLEQDSHTRASSAGGLTEEVEDWSVPRMLQDSNNPSRILYVGESATLSCLQLIRMLVEIKVKHSKFTQDPQRHMIVEAPSNPQSSNTPMCLLPDVKTATILVNSYFTNTVGFVEVFDRANFHDQFNSCFDDPLTVDPSVRCLLNLVFAIGLVLANPEPKSEEAEVIRKLRENDDINHAEVFFRNAKALADPESGFEDANIWSVQALCLMAIYMLSVSKRNAAYAYLGMAVRSAFALGLHRVENDYSFDRNSCSNDPIIYSIHGRVRRNLWRTLYILDRFLSASLGRPMAISDEDCSEKPLGAGEKTMESEDEKINSAALYAAVSTCRVIGKTLKDVYSKRKISCIITQEIAEKLVDWNRALHLALHWRKARNIDIPRNRRITILHINLLHCHSVILLTRPFFLYILKVGIMQQKQSRLSQRMDGFAQTCVEAAQHSLTIAQDAMNGRCLSHCNPFVIYYVFAAGLIILSNEFASLYNNPDADVAIESCLSILGYCAEHDPQAKRVHYIIKTFQEVIMNRASAAPVLSFRDRTIPIITPASSNPDHDPMAHFFENSKSSPKVHQLPIVPPTLRPERSSMSAHFQRRPSSSIISVHQQPSPDVTDGSPTAVASASASEGNPNMDHGFFLDELFQFPIARMPMEHQQHVQPEAYNNHYTLGSAPSLPFGPNSMPPVSLGAHGNMYYPGDGFQ